MDGTNPSAKHIFFTKNNIFSFCVTYTYVSVLHYDNKKLCWIQTKRGQHKIYKINLTYVCVGVVLCFVSVCLRLCLCVCVSVCNSNTDRSQKQNYLKTKCTRDSLPTFVTWWLLISVPAPNSRAPTIKHNFLLHKNWLIWTFSLCSRLWLYFPISLNSSCSGSSWYSYNFRNPMNMGMCTLVGSECVAIFLSVFLYLVGAAFLYWWWTKVTVMTLCLTWTVIRSRRRGQR